MASITVLTLGQETAYPILRYYSPEADQGWFLYDSWFHLPLFQPLHCFCSSSFFSWDDEDLVSAVLEIVWRVFCLFLAFTVSSAFITWDKVINIVSTVFS